MEESTTSDVSETNSISGPSKRSSGYTTFIFVLCCMIICGSWNDFLGKLIYQLYPEQGTGFDSIKNNYLITFLLTFGSFVVCSFAVFTKSSLESFKKMDKRLFIKISIPSIIDLLVTGGRYLGLALLPAPIVSILKNGAQLLFLALLRKCFHDKYLKCCHWIGIVLIIIGLTVVSLESIFAANNNTKDANNEEPISLKDSIIGVVIMIIVGLFGAIRNDIEEILLKNDNLSSDFVVGMESIISSICTFIAGILFIVINPFNKNENETINMLNNMLTIPIIICFILFLCAIYGKDTNQMKMTSLTSSLTRKLFQQIYPSGTWIISLLCFVITSNLKYGHYGESWNGKYSLLRLSGFIIVFIGNYIYIKGGYSNTNKIKYKIVRMDSSTDLDI